MLATSILLGGGAAASAETRTLKLYFIHTGEKAQITFKRNGRYDANGLKQINNILRDWRRNEPTKMDPRLLDLVWEAYRASGSNDYIHVVSAYRSPATNSMLRSRSKGVAKKSQHMLGKAMDFYLPDVRLKKLREIGLKMQGGGVGYYPTSGSPFVHFDVGNVRHWPKMSRKELVALFPSGKTLHVPSDGKPLPGFEQAVAAYESRRKSGGSAIALASSGGRSRSGGLLAALFGGGADEEEESGGAVVAAAADEPEPKPARQQKPAPQKVENPANGQIRILPPELARPADVARPAEEPAQETIVAALPTRDVPLPAVAPRPKTDVGAPLVDLDSNRGPLVDLSSQGDEPAAEVALNVPLPTRRPAYAPPAELATAQDALLVASTQVEELQNAVAVPLPSSRPADTIASAAVAALPASMTAVPEAAAYAAPEPRAPVPSASPLLETAGFKPAPEEIIAVPKMERTAAVAASPKMALAARAPGSDPASAFSGVKTTAKSARPGAADSKPEPKPVVLAAQPRAARWALDGNYIANNTDGTKAPSYANKIVYSAPREVYTAGFQQGDQQLADANRFTGKAVTFLSVARFN
ncbi:peptidase M15 [Mesorhizobium sp. L-8-10]|nr:MULTISPECIES: DUF882 domain-containing protein [unclassified Mesorhizobium]BCH23082.1 peptidase M15 [Mesorhizobium sp. L-8-3]BCH30895.1 peptidase M15 [Mesorhizobium sp. L-8-10]